MVEVELPEYYGSRKKKPEHVSSIIRNGFYRRIGADFSKSRREFDERSRRLVI